MMDTQNFEDMEFSEEHKDFVLGAVMGYSHQLDTKFAGYPVKEKVGAMYDAIDAMNKEALELTEKQEGKVVSCRKGCAHCCHIQVAATEWEVETILEYMKHKGMEFEESDIQKLERLSLVKDDHEYMVHPDRRCVFLGDDNMCQIYEVRPSACRNYYVFSDPEDCDTYKQVGAGRVLTFFNLNTIAPIITLMEKSSLGPFQNQILKLLKERKTNVFTNSNNAGSGNTTERQLHSGEQSQKQ